jgi:hypothetical protein
MAFTDRFTHLLSVASRTMSETVAYTPVGGTAGNISAVVTRQEVIEEGGQTIKIAAKMLVQAAEVAAPVYRDQATIDGQGYTVARVRRQTANYFELDLRRGERLKF